MQTVRCKQIHNYSPSSVARVSPLKKQQPKKNTSSRDTPLPVVMSDASTQPEIIWGHPAAADGWHDGLCVNAVWLGRAADPSESRWRSVTSICVTDQMQESKRLQENRNLLAHKHIHTHVHVHGRWRVVDWRAPSCSVTAVDRLRL